MRFELDFSRLLTTGFTTRDLQLCHLSERTDYPYSLYCYSFQVNNSRPQPPPSHLQPSFRPDSTLSHTRFCYWTPYTSFSSFFLHLSQTDELIQFLVIAVAVSGRRSLVVRVETAVKIASLIQRRLLDLNPKTSQRTSLLKKEVFRKRSIFFSLGTSA